MVNPLSAGGLQRWGRRAMLGAALGVLAACATISRPVAPAAGEPAWSGRLALTVHSTPAQTTSANFDLRGDARSGELALYSPLGTTLALLRWNPQGAQLQQGGTTTPAESVQALLLQVTGTELPVAALFEWLQGRASRVDGWSADQSQWAEGRLRVQRVSPEPQVDLRIVLD